MSTVMGCSVVKVLTVATYFPEGSLHSVQPHNAPQLQQFQSHVEKHPCKYLRLTEPPGGQSHKMQAGIY